MVADKGIVLANAPERLEYHEAKSFSLLEQVLRTDGRGLAQNVAIAASILSVALALFHLYVAAFGTPESRSFRSTHLTVMLVLAILLNPLFRSSLVTLAGVIIVVVHAWLIFELRIVGNGDYSDDRIYFVPMAAALAAVPVTILAMQKCCKYTRDDED